MAIKNYPQVLSAAPQQYPGTSHAGGGQSACSGGCGCDGGCGGPATHPLVDVSAIATQYPVVAPNGVRAPGNLAGNLLPRGEGDRVPLIHDDRWTAPFTPLPPPCFPGFSLRQRCLTLSPETSACLQEIVDLINEEMAERGAVYPTDLRSGDRISQTIAGAYHSFDNQWYMRFLDIFSQIRMGSGPDLGLGGLSRWVGCLTSFVNFITPHNEATVREMFSNPILLFVLSGLGGDIGVDQGFQRLGGVSFDGLSPGLPSSRICGDVCRPTTVSTFVDPLPVRTRESLARATRPTIRFPPT